MPKIFQARVIYQAIRAGTDDMPAALFEWVTLEDAADRFAVWHYEPAVKAALKFQFPVLRRLRRGFVPWAPDDQIMVQSLHELWFEWSENDRPQPMQRGVIECRDISML